MTSAAVVHAWRRPIFLGVSAALVLGVLFAARPVLLPFIMAVVIAYVLTPLVAWVERRKVPRAGAILLVYASVLTAVFMFLHATAPRLGKELRSLRTEVPALLSAARDKWVPEAVGRLRAMSLLPSTPTETVQPTPEPNIVFHQLPDGSFGVDVGSGFVLARTKEGYLVTSARERREEALDVQRLVSDTIDKSFAYAQHNALEIARIGRDIVSGISRGIFLFFITLMLAAYLMMTRERVLSFFMGLARPSARPTLLQLLDRIDRGLSGVIRGQLIICLVNGVLSAIGFAIVGLKYWPVLALVAAVLSLIPIFGSIISTVPAVAIGLTQGVGTALFVFVWILLIHQLEANFLNPKIMGDAAKIHPVLVVFSLLVGEHFFGTVGALLAVPCMSIAKSLFLHFQGVANRSDPELASEPEGPSSAGH